MNILYCGDLNIIDGLIISILSLLKNTKDSLYIYVFTMNYSTDKKKYKPMSHKYIDFLDNLVKDTNKNSFVKLIDVTDIANKCLPKANLNTVFTPFCMLRLYADQIDELPSKILYLDNDVVCMKNPKSLFNIDNKNYELVGVLDYYGSHIFKKNFKKQYMNSGVLLLNLDLIREAKLFEKARLECQNKKMIMPDQSALNKYCKKRLLIDRIYNEQHDLSNNTVFRHFSNTFKFFPVFKVQKIKPWHIDKLHNILNCYEIDDILEKYLDIKRRIIK